MDTAINQIAGGRTLDYHKVLVENAKLVGDVLTLRQQLSELEATAASYKQQLSDMAMEVESMKDRHFKRLEQEAEKRMTLKTQLAAANAEIERVKKDAENWRKYQERKRQLIESGFLKSLLRNDATMSAMKEDGK